MKKLRIIALLLALTLCLTACAGTSGTGANSAEPEEIELETDSDTDIDAEEADFSDEDAAIPAEAIEDAVYYLTDGAYSADTVITTIGDTPVTAAEVFYWIAYELYYQITYYNTYYEYYYGISAGLSVSDEYGDGTVGEYLFQLGAQDAMTYAALAQKAAELDVPLSEEDASAVETLYDDNVLTYGESLWDTCVSQERINEEDFTEEERDAWILKYGEEYYLAYMAYCSTTATGMENVYTNSCYYPVLQDFLFTDGGTYEPTEETLADYTDSYVEDNGVVWARCILFSTQECEDDEAVAAVKDQADAVYALLAELNGDELAEQFTEMQSEYDTSGYEAGEVEMYTNSDSLVDGYYDGITVLETGELGMTNETDYGYFILLREEDQREDLDLEEDYINTTFASLVTEWLDEYEAVCELSEMDSADVAAYFARLEELQSELDTALSAD